MRAYLPQLASTRLFTETSFLFLTQQALQSLGAGTAFSPPEADPIIGCSWMGTVVGQLSEKSGRLESFDPPISYLSDCHWIRLSLKGCSPKNTVHYLIRS
jgi:hypothetical protein